MTHKLIASALLLTAIAFSAGCARHEAAAAPAAQALPVKMLPIVLEPVPQSDEYVSTIKSRRSATLNPQLDGNITQILVRSGDRVKTGQLLMMIDPTRQQAVVDAERSAELQSKALYDYNGTDVERQRRLYNAGVISREAREQADQAFANSKAAYEAAVANRITQERQLAYYHIKAPFDGVVGDIPVHLGDYVSGSTLLTTVDERKDLEAYIYIPTELAGKVRSGLGVQIFDNNGKLLEETKIDFVSPQVDNQLQGILAKAPVHATPDIVRNAQLVKARVIWSVAPAPVVPVLAVTRLNGQSFVYVAHQQDGKYTAKQRAVRLGDTIGNTYAVLDGLREGDKVIVSGTQFLVDGAPVQPLG